MSKAADRKVSVSKNAQVHQRFVVGELAYQEQDQRDAQQQCGPADPGGAEPVVFLAFVEDDLQCAQPHRQQSQADAVDSSGLGVLDVRRIFDEPHDHQDGQDADGNVDVEGPAPGIGVRQISAESWSKDGRDDHAQREDRQRTAALVGRKTLQQNGLRQGLQRAAAGALDGARDQDGGQAPGRSAGKGRNREDDDAGDEKALASELQREPRTGGQHYGVRYQVTGQDPGGFVVRG